MKEQLLKELKTTIVENLWDDKNLIIRAMFTTLIYTEDMYVGDAEPILKELYEDGAIEDLDISYTEFKTFMLEDIKKQF